MARTSADRDEGAGSLPARAGFGKGDEETGVFSGAQALCGNPDGSLGKDWSGSEAKKKKKQQDQRAFIEAQETRAKGAQSNNPNSWVLWVLGKNFASKQHQIIPSLLASRPLRIVYCRLRTFLPEVKGGHPAILNPTLY
ncbi:hypothetical protein FA13DRAFT_1713986 [Coprinellus micaceus]|uniref:Uncharacterized protein n=1 Tax=Coprinellus micaceus TaxID=71717 RepID=A0A4Y7SUM2_COPMI|nr:hypothetical protein FA13DRAFT_1713986 [Coprinellus micaceus]